tara:strand:+ start:758 stop:964 length:207 start_codon:yes stop_codon:yes gene_type:complete
MIANFDHVSTDKMISTNCVSGVIEIKRTPSGDFTAKSTTGHTFMNWDDFEELVHRLEAEFNWSVDLTV